jgi:hypothetical protein
MKLFRFDPSELGVLIQSLRQAAASVALPQGTRTVYPKASLSTSTSPTVYEVYGKLFRWSIVYERVLHREEDPHSFDEYLYTLTLPMNQVPTIVCMYAKASFSCALIPPPNAYVSLFRKVFSDISRFDSDPVAIHALDTGRSPLSPVGVNTRSGWSALDYIAHAVRTRLNTPINEIHIRCKHGIVHPHHFDDFGNCRCSQYAWHHRPLLRQWKWDRRLLAVDP